jgi:hypothetical protein
MEERNDAKFRGPPDVAAECPELPEIALSLVRRAESGHAG